MAPPESRVVGPFPEYRLDLTQPLDRARGRERAGDLDGALLLASGFFEETVKEIEGGKAELVPNAAGAARCVVRCLVKQENSRKAHGWLSGARERVRAAVPAPGTLRLEGRLLEEGARLQKFEEVLGEFRARVEEFRSRPQPGVQSHALPLGLSARHAAAACRDMAAPALGVRLLAEAAGGLLSARSTDLRALVTALELLAAEMDRLGSPSEAARAAGEARRRAEATLALFRAVAASPRVSAEPVARWLRLEAAHLRRAGEGPGAGRLLDLLARLQPGDAALELALLGEWARALDDLGSAAPPPEEVPFVLEFRALLLRRLGREAEARRCAHDALVLHRPPGRPPLEDEWYQRWLSRLNRTVGEYRRLRLQEAAGEQVAPALEALAAEAARDGLEVHAMERGVADEAAGHILLRADRREAAFHSFHRALETYREESWEESEHVYEDDFLMLDALGREEALLRLADPRWRTPPERVEALMRAAFQPDEFRRFGDHSVEDYFAGLFPGPLDRDPEEVTAEIRLPEARPT